MKIKIDSCISNSHEFYGTIYPESEKERDELHDLLEVGESVKIAVLTGKSEEGKR